jgi:hypothetical protein
MGRAFIASGRALHGSAPPLAPTATTDEVVRSPPPPERDSLSVFRKRETLCEAKSMYNAERIIDTCFEHDWGMMQRERGEAAILSYIGLKGDKAGLEKLARRWCWGDGGGGGRCVCGGMGATGTRTHWLGT